MNTWPELLKFAILGPKKRRKKRPKKTAKKWRNLARLFWLGLRGWPAITGPACLVYILNRHNLRGKSKKWRN